MKTPKIMAFVQSIGPKGKETEDVFVYGPTTRSDEGIVGYDLRCRPTRLGAGEYTFVTSPDNLEEIPTDH